MARGNNEAVALLKMLHRLEQSTPLNREERMLKVSLEADTAITARLHNKRLKWHWSQTELREIDRLIARRKRLGRPKPFQVDKEVWETAERMGRTYMAVHRMIERRRKQKQRDKCSDAQNGNEA